jgi:hypothetical protein
MAEKEFGLFPKRKKFNHDEIIHKRWTIVVDENKNAYPRLESIPEDYADVMNRFLYLFPNVKSIQKAIDELDLIRAGQNKGQCLGMNEDLITFDLEKNIAEYYTISLSEDIIMETPIESLISFFIGYKSWMEKYESGQIIKIMK